ncbi:hypothetical protein [Streptomyces sp. NPDC090112]|uniref:hypothetical protein n=1 Tax=Streptomyces sp. NPDC090112 TaxID=3365949 RepID=UPI0037F62C97
MREAIGADDWVGHRAWLSTTLPRDGRLDDVTPVVELRVLGTVEAIAVHPTVAEQPTPAPRDANLVDPPF